MRVNTEDLVHRIFHLAGVDITRYPGQHHGRRRALLLKSAQITLVLDVGANEGNYASQLREFGFGGRILSFEPLSDAYKKLSKRAARDEAWEVQQIAIGDTSGSAVLNVAGNSESSSLLPMLEEHRRAAPSSAYIGTQQTRVERLDRLWIKDVRDDDVAFLKTDTQGFERQVLDGIGEHLDTLHGVEIEMSLVPLYEGSMLFMEAHARLTGAGLELVSVEPVFADPLTGRLLQVDGIFMRV